MSKKVSRSPSIAPLQRVVAKPITDPAEQAALDEIRKREKRKRVQEATANRRFAKAISTKDEESKTDDAPNE
jgi:hypothetical protein